MSNRVSVLKYIVENGPSTRDAVIESLDAERQALTQTFYQLVQAEHLTKSGETADPNTTYAITEKGTDYYQRNKDKPPRDTRNKTSRQPVPEVAPAPVVPNISVSAESLADSVSQVLFENSELRNALVEIRSTINRLLGDSPQDDSGQQGNVIEFGGEK